MYNYNSTSKVAKYFIVNSENQANFKITPTISNSHRM